MAAHNWFILQEHPFILRYSKALVPNYPRHGSSHANQTKGENRTSAAPDGLALSS